MNKKNMFDQKVSLKAHLIARVFVLLFLVSALYFTLDEHYQKIETSIFSLLMVIIVVLAVAISIGITVHTFWKFRNRGKNT